MTGTYLKLENNAESTLDGEITSTDTSIAIVSSSSFPNTFPFILTIWDELTYPDPSDDTNMEMVLIGGVTSNTFTSVTRGYGSTTGVIHATSSKIALVMTKEVFTDATYGVESILDEHLDNTSNPHSVDATDIGGSNIVTEINSSSSLIDDNNIAATIARDSEVTADITTHASNADAHHNESHTVASHSDTSVTGSELDADHTKLAGIETGATADQTGAEIKTAYEHESDTNAYTDSEKTKLAGVATGATANSNDATLLARANHTGTQDATTIDVADSSNYYDGTNAETVLAEIGESRAVNGYDLLTPNSLPDLSFTDGTRTFSASVKSGQPNYYFWVDSKKYIKTTTQTVVVPDVTGTYYIVFNNSGALVAVNETALSDENFYENAITGLVYWNATDGTGMVGNEMHGRLMDARTHQYNHATFGARYESGLNIEGLTDGGSTYTQTTSGYFWDEDIRHTVSAQSTHPFLYRLGADGEWTRTTPSNEVSYNNGGTYDVWNEWTGSTWQLTEGTSSTDFWIIFYIATPDINGYPIKKIIGQNAYPNRSAARNAIATELDTLSMNGLPSPEFIFLYATIVKRTGVIEDDADGNTYYDLRTYKGGSGGTSGSTGLAGDINTDVASFNTQLSASDTNVQLALDTLDDHVHTVSQITNFDSEVGGTIAVTANTAKITYPGSADTAELNILDGATLTTTELNYVDGVTSAIQTQIDGKLSLSGGTMTGDIDANNNDIIDVKTVTFNGEYDNGNSGSADTIDFNNAQNQKSLMTDNCTYTFTPPTSGDTTIKLKLVQDATGNRVPTWPSNINWAGGEPTWSTAANAVDIATIYYDGTEYWGMAGIGFV